MSWNLDTAHSSIGFSVRHMVVASVKGQFGKFDVDATIDEANLANSSAIVHIDAASIDTRDPKRDEHLASPDFFEVEKFPELIFKTTRVEPKGDEYRITGDLTIHGVTKPVTLEGEISGPVKDPWGGTRAGLSAQGKVNRKDFGMGFNAVLEAGGFVVGEDIKLSIDLELVKAA
jgi:polyisoprenoid-binding protein YceI